MVQQSRISTHEGVEASARAQTPVMAPAPGTQETSAEPSRYRLRANNAGSQAVILIIDDESAIAESLGQILRFYGYTVYSFTNSLDGLAWYALHRHKVDLVLLDLIMPEMDGESCFLHIRDIAPSQKVALMSGYCQEQVVEKLLALGALKFFDKPLNFEQLMSWVGQTLCRDTAKYRIGECG